MSGAEQLRTLIGVANGNAERVRAAGDLQAEQEYRELAAQALVALVAVEKKTTSDA